MGGSFAAATVVRILVNFAVPFAVASFGYLSACRTPRPCSPADRPRAASTQAEAVGDQPGS